MTRPEAFQIYVDAAGDAMREWITRFGPMPRARPDGRFGYCTSEGIKAIKEKRDAS